MAHNPEWHAEYRRLEIAEEEARTVYRAARKAMERKRPAAGAEVAYEAALAELRAAGTARWDFEMAAARIAEAA